MRAKVDQVIDLGEVAMDAGKKLWRAINGKKPKARAASDSGRPHLDDPHSVGGPTVGASGHNTEREILVRGFAVPEEDEDDDEDEDEDEDDGGNGDQDDEDDDEDDSEQSDAQHRTEDFVAGIQAMHILDSKELLEVQSDEARAYVDSSHVHPARLSPPPLSPRSESSDLGASDSSTASGVTTPNPEREAPLSVAKDNFFSS